jgi:hypothetical protein
MLADDPGILLAFQHTACRNTGDTATAEFVDGFGNPLGPSVTVERYSLNPLLPLSVLEIHFSYELPEWASDVGILLNGWQLAYLDGDHNVSFAQANLHNPRVERGRLLWSAMGAILDGESEHPFSLCVDFVVLAWNDAYVQAEFQTGDNAWGGPVFSTNLSKNSPRSCELRRVNFADAFPHVWLPRGALFHWYAFKSYPLKRYGREAPAVFPSPDSLLWESCATIEDEKNAMPPRPYYHRD